KQVSNSKGVSSVHKGTGGGGEPWEDIYEFTPGRLRELPLPANISTRHSAELDRLARAVSTSTPASVLAAGAPTAKRLTDAHARWMTLRAQRIALAEEQDWEIYSLYGVLADSTLAQELADVPPLRPGERAFEIALARSLASKKDITTRWFTRHGSVPVTEL